MENVMTVTKDDRQSSETDEYRSSLTRELAQRQNGGVEVLLLWRPATDQVELSVHDSTTGAGFQIEVAPSRAMDAFYHPYAYAAELESFPGVDRDEAAIVDG